MNMVQLAVKEARRCNRMVLFCDRMANSNEVDAEWWANKSEVWRAARLHCMADAREWAETYDNLSA